MVSSVSFWLRYWYSKDKTFCERRFTLYGQQSEKNKQHVDLAPPRKSLANAHEK